VLELQYRIKEEVQELRQHAENLETDSSNVNLRLEHVELEKRTLMEQYEELNDEKMNLEDEVDTGRLHTNSELQKELEEKLFAFEAIISEKEVENSRRMKDLEVYLQKGVIL
jgi:hypothetical protein